MVDVHAQQERRRQLVNQARAEKNGLSNWLPIVPFSMFCAILPGIAVHVVRWFINSGQKGPAYAHAETSMLTSYLLAVVPFAVFWTFVQLGEVHRAEQRAIAQADELDHRDMLAASRAASEAALANQRRREAAEAERQQQIMARKWEVERLAREKAEHLASLERKVVEGWIRYQLERDFLGDADKAELRREFKKELRRVLPADDLRLLDTSQVPEVQALKGVGFLY